MRVKEVCEKCDEFQELLKSLIEANSESEAESHHSDPAPVRVESQGKYE